METYLAIQKLRFVDKFESYFKISEDIDTDQIFILPLILQPIVENAILHGLEEKEENGKIVISIYRRKQDTGELLCIDVSDNGYGMTEEMLENLRQSIEQHDLERSKSIGLYNINQRIKLSYGMEYGMMITSVPGEGTTVSLCFPLEMMKEKIT